MWWWWGEGRGAIVVVDRCWEVMTSFLKNELGAANLLEELEFSFLKIIRWRAAANSW